MFTVMLSAFRGERTLEENTLKSAELACLLVQGGYTPEVVLGFYPENGSQVVTFEQSYAVRCERMYDVLALARLAGDAFQQECVMVVDVLDRMKASYVWPEGDTKELGFLRRSEEQPEGARSQWRGAWWSIKEVA